MAADELDELYRLPPEDFTAARSRLVKAARSRGEADRAAQIAAARKPTTAAWLVNSLVHRDAHVVDRLGELGDRLHAAHRAADGDRIRELSAEHRRLVAELAESALTAVAAPSAAVRDDVTATLHAAVADAAVRARLGRLTRAERWSGFGEFGDSAPIVAAATSVPDDGAPAAGHRRRAEPAPDEAAATTSEQSAATDAARAAVARAERIRADLDTQVGERRAELAAARLAHDDARSRLEQAGARLQAAENAHAEAVAAHQDAAAELRSAKNRLAAVQRTGRRAVSGTGKTPRQDDPDG
ncbi:hypothetical protein [Mycolicibacterium thermoresistibile]|uniref:Uncharacterized protein n=2 Tax=Mycolicibacterium thermoresistibile TaxID=1797 RepID=G7CM52_MYCT3|nr:hypothetical protein [Mycolicibacterium thermoresistibile]EHI11005.1 hypothetical protein KEK_20483 [Mycolicibacterium thermoresistibile ATCC 19527]MCV7188237.1 hypothetical protein [Mycolicibacterium thermoresistibile]GAT13313.1 putative uncharacterized protein [Mycolicibacterium thermoresistibile]SNW18513.1 Uncharacterised protein [Mycolicibacterium thermoresistibile]